MNSMALYGRALYDYHNKNFSHKLYMCRDDGFKFELPVDVFFRDSIDLEIDKKALAMCYGKVLDVGAGTGLHSLYLQNEGMDVTALDVLDEACEVMRNKCVKKTICANILDYSEEQFDTILVLGRSIGAIGTIDRLPMFFRHIRKILNKNGQILLNSCDLRKSSSEKELQYVKRNLESGIYFGEITYSFEYGGKIGEKFKWIQIDKYTLMELLKAEQMSCEVIHEEIDGNYLVRIT
ncbi:class I SAM-dependent methyltransferase [Dethiobacter alkaliphilus]|uniref:class I SAM-dependent methyltransferase n=1 Tax=Dethiobacter alkaliphilus TaxID=427926 RepID=UPI002226042C|nr:class I SAM-dependent methyltransferase [Dethiobacter alkaliphilus]MCW3491704.1 class I SAM-dependent methyltransferase [Dethiobacter alkaliphilus]